MISRLLVFSVLAAGLLSGCLTQGVPVTVTPMSEKPRLSISPRQNLASIKFDKVLFNLRRGDVVGQYMDSLFGRCYPFADNAYWSSGRVVVSNRDLDSLFFEAMRESNYNIVGDPTRLFQTSESSESKRPDYLIGAHVEQIKMQICDEFNFASTGGLALPISRGFRSGRASMRVRWQVFDVLNRKVVHEFVTEGYTNLTEGLPDGETRLIQDAFASAARNLAAEPSFVAGLALPVDGPKTLNGLILEHLQDIPESGVSVKIGDVPMEIVQTQDRIIKTVRIFKPRASLALGPAESATAKSTPSAH